MVLLVGATAYLIGLWPALTIAGVGWAARGIHRLLAEERRQRIERFRDRWSYRFHREFFAEGKGRRRSGS
ncbi:MAG: hypothetical protein KDK07_03010 [Bauldia sp.]|nr:hypothetical protein [Bauldia sp.]